MYLHLRDEIRIYKKNPTQERWDYIVSTSSECLDEGLLFQEEFLMIISALTK